MSTYTIRIEGEWHLTEEELWPDGDAPPAPSVDDVAALVRRYSTERLISEWMLEPNVEVQIGSDIERVR